MLVDAADSDASCIAFATIDSNTARTLISVDTATSSLLPFPTKLAHFITSAAGLVSSTRCDPADAELPANAELPSSSRLSIRRENLLADSIAALATLARASVRAAIRVDFKDEHGIAAGGVYREWFLLMNEAIVTPEAGIFTCVDHQSQSFYLNPHSREILGEDHLAHFLAAGRLLGRALLDGNVTGFHLAMPLLKIVLGQPVSFSDLQYYDPEVHKHLTWLLEHDGVDTLCLDFTVTEKLPDGRTCTVELVEGGAEIEVTDLNKVEFVDAKLKYLLFKSVSEQLFAYLTGVYEVVPADFLAIFDAEELECLISGSDQIDVDDWEANSIAPKSWLLQSSLCYFWRAVRGLSLEERQRLLQFATGSSRVPPGGFRALTSNDGKLCLFNFRGVPPSLTRGYLYSHACFNRLDLPLHGSTEMMRQAIQAAISSDSTGFTTA